MLKAVKKLLNTEKILGNLLIIFCLILPFQFALNPHPGIDLAMARVFILLISILYLLLERKQVFSFNKDSVTILLSIFLGMVLISTFRAQNIVWSFRKLLFLFSMIPLFCISSNLLQNKGTRKRTIECLVMGAFGLSVLAIIQFLLQFIFGIDTVYNFLAVYITPFFLGHSFSNTVLAFPSWLVSSNNITYMRAVAIFPDPHMLSYYFGMLLPWAIYLAVGRFRENKIYLFIPISLAIADIFTFTRGSYIGLVSAAAVTLPLVSKNTRIKILGFMLTLILLLQFIPNDPVGNRFVSSFDSNEGSNHARISNWQQALLIIKDNPLGVGIGNYSLHVKPNASYREPIYAHNLYLDIAAEIGVLGSFVFISILTAAFLNFYKKAKQNNFFIAGTASITYFSIHSLVETPLYSVHILPLILIILAISTVNYPNENSITKSV